MQSIATPPTPTMALYLTGVAERCGLCHRAGLAIVGNKVLAGMDSYRVWMLDQGFNPYPATGIIHFLAYHSCVAELHKYSLCGRVQYCTTSARSAHNRQTSRTSVRQPARIMRKRIDM